MKYEKVLTKKFFKHLENISSKSDIIDKEEKFFERFKKAIANLKKE
jgi:hypothetical protein